MSRTAKVLLVVFVSIMICSTKSNAQSKNIHQLSDSLASAIKLDTSILLPYKKAFKFLEKKGKAGLYKKNTVLKLKKSHIDSLVKIDSSYRLIADMYEKKLLIDNGFYSITIAENNNNTYNIRFVFKYVPRIETVAKCYDNYYCDDAFFAIIVSPKFGLNKFESNWYDDFGYHILERDVCLYSTFDTSNIKQP
jgi:hypothetical protein